MVCICIFGESTTWGAWDEEKGGWVNRLKLSLSPLLNYDIEIYNLGVSGDTTNDILKRFDVEARARKPDVIIFSCGGNDSGCIKSDGNYIVKPKKYEKNLKKLVKKAKKFTNKVIFMGLKSVDNSKTLPVPWDKERYYFNHNMELYDNILKKFCKENKLHFIDTINLLCNKDLDEDDGLHLNSNGHKKIFSKVKDYLLKNKIIRKPYKI